ncbi:FMRFamide receptor-like protein [Leptotrombidium deliense]|uniref:FMRFamide receptor-like protein n=1 Tax=Leptotrombidium deliense TaxID=299467 RepID=A0A443S967_9ACAR|nr:FMRFamide receptor-like protein [Leptotrombidium deliense]
MSEPITIWIEFWVSGVVLTTMCSFGLLGNTVTLFILNFSKEMRKQPINLYLTVLAVYDNGVLFNAILMLGIPALCKIQHIQYIQRYYYNFHNESTLLENITGNISEVNAQSDNGSIYVTPNEISDDSEPFINPLHVYIQVVYPLALISQTGSIWTTCLITAERYLAVCNPLRAMTLSTRSRATWALLTLSIGAFLYNIPRFFEIEVADDEVIRTDLRMNTVYFWLYYICLHLILLYIIPLTLLSVMNTKIYFAVRKASRDRSRLSASQQVELNIASMLVLLVAIFIACNAPSFIVNCLELLETSYLQTAAIFSNLLVCFNSSVNFVIYCIFGKKFRSKLSETFCCSSAPQRHRSCSRNMFANSYAGETYV